MRILALLCLALSMVVGRAQVMSVGTTNDLAMLPNPSSIHSNTLVTAETTVGDNTMAVWTWVKGLAAAPAGATVLDSLTHPGEGLFVKGLQSISSSGTNYFYTIITTNLTVIETNTVNYMIVTNITVISNITVGGSNLAIINPTDNYIPYRVNTNSFGDSPWYVISTNSLGFGSTNIFFYFDPDQAFPDYSRISIGDGILTNAVQDYGTVAIGTRVFNLAQVANASVGIGWEAAAYATNVADVVAIGYGTSGAEDIQDTVLIGNGAGPSYSPTLVQDVYIGDTSGVSMRGSGNVAIGAHAGDLIPAADITGTNIIVIGAYAKATNDNEIVIGNATNTKAIFPITSYTGTGANALTDDGTFKAFAAASDTLWTNKSSILQPKDLTLPLMWTNKLSLSESFTNLVYRDGSYVIYSNEVPKVRLYNGTATFDLELASGPTGNITVSGGGNTVVNGPLEIKGDLFPSPTSVYSLGRNTTYGLLNNLWLRGTNFFYAGDVVQLTNYIRLAETMSGQTAVLDIQSLTNNVQGPITGFSFRTNGVEIGKFPTTSGSTPIAFKSSFTTNFTVTSAAQLYMLGGTNQIITLPSAASSSGILYRFSSTNGRGSFVITNAADGATIRDGTSLSYTNIGINEFGLVSDGSNWWLASKARTVMPSASWSLTNTITPVQDVITNIPFTSLEFNNSQGINLLTKAGYTGATELWVTNAGTYMITFSAVLKGSGGGTKLSIWLRQNGADVTRTRTDQGFTGATAQQCMTVNYFVQVGASPSYFELVAASHDASPPTIESAVPNPTGYTAPAMPGVIVTVNRVSDLWP